MTERHLFWPWAVAATACVIVMQLMPGLETVAFHVGYIGLGVAAGLDRWSAARGMLSLAAYAIASGVVMVARAAAGVIEWAETAEIPLMFLLLAMVMWHIEWRNRAADRLNLVMEAEQSAIVRRERLFRLSSHEMRTPLTIAGGYVDAMLQEEPEPGVADDLQVVREELDRSSMAVDRLLRLLSSPEGLEAVVVDLDALLADACHRWQVVADRDWVLDSDCGAVRCDVERLRACLDTLLENAVRYTDDGDRIRVFGWTDEREYGFGVGDAGPGFRADQLAAINAGPDESPNLALVPDSLTQTGLGLALVREIIQARAGRLRAGRSLEGGAEVEVVAPRWAEPGPSAPIVAMGPVHRRS